eukprot:TRINITY_DN43860_c0_g1_i1.p1 TRINITY_DN43860_c0_g1~~TRINITY_DN43860_c0_g1_i1.p1  ORF type:complete len:319 (+),score=62.12 TRINITY_DN43860_c0_g1_i1:49-957(+)
MQNFSIWELLRFVLSVHKWLEEEREEKDDDDKGRLRWGLRGGVGSRLADSLQQCCRSAKNWQDSDFPGKWSIFATVWDRIHGQQDVLVDRVAAERQTLLRRLKCCQFPQPSTAWQSGRPFLAGLTGGELAAGPKWLCIRAQAEEAGWYALENDYYVSLRLRENCGAYRLLLLSGGGHLGLAIVEMDGIKPKVIRLMTEVDRQRVDDHDRYKALLTHQAAQARTRAQKEMCMCLRRPGAVEDARTKMKQEAARYQKLIEGAHQHFLQQVARGTWTRHSGSGDPSVRVDVSFLGTAEQEPHGRM